MKRILLIVAMLLMAAPALAAVSVTATYEGSGVVRVSYTADVNVRAFALDINVGGVMTIDDICDFNVGDTNGYGIFPGKFRDYIDAGDPNFDLLNYNPVAPVSDPDANDTGLGGKYITVELGSLGVVDLATIRSGVLFRLVCDCNGGPSELLHITANATRGGVVGEDGSSIIPTLNDCTVVCVCTAVVPDVVGETEAVAINTIEGVDTLDAQYDVTLNAYSATIAVGNVVATNPIANTTVACGSIVKYGLSLGTWPVPNVYNMLPAAADTAITNAHYVVGTISYDWSAVVGKGKVMAQSPAAGGQYACGTPVNYTISRGPTPWACFDPCTAATTQKAQYNLYVAAKWDPNCWCEYHAVNCPGCGFQCHGDADGKKTTAPNNFRIYTLDLGMVTGNWQKKLLPYPNGANPCADIDHKATTAPNSFRVYTLDLQRLTSQTVGNWQRKGCIEATGTLPRNCPYSDAKNNAAYVRPLACNEGK